MNRILHHLPLIGLFAIFLQHSVRADSIVVFNEVMYNPAGADEVGFEWIELHNQNAVDVDLSGWYFSDGVDFTFPPGAVIRSGGYIVIASTPANLTAMGVTNVVGPFAGRLSNSGEDLDLRDIGHRRMDSLNYGDEEEWPSASDGGGSSLSKRHPDLGSQRAENWTFSSKVGGTPGAANFSTSPAMQLAINEMTAESFVSFWLEIMNTGTNAVDLDGVILTRSGGGNPSHVLPSLILQPGEQTTITQAQMGFGAGEGLKFTLYTPDGSNTLDAAIVQSNNQARLPDGTGEWLIPSVLTPGASNPFNLNHDIVINEVMYHYPPTDPMPTVTTNLISLPITNVWRYDDSGFDPGSTWPMPNFDDSSWNIGSGVLGFNPTNLPAPVNTILDGGRTTYYFRTTFAVTGSLSNLCLDLRFLIDDGAVFYLNGSEFHRYNMPSGPVTQSTIASDPVGDAVYIDALELPATYLVQGTNVLAVEVHQSAGGAVSSGLVLSGGGLTLVEEGPFGGTPPPNLALMSGVTPFAIDSLTGFPIHDIGNLNDGSYGNSFSWIGNSGSPGYCGLDFNGSFSIAGIAFGRDNLGMFGDRTLGLYTLQFTEVASPGTGTPDTGNPNTGWATIGTIDYQFSGSGLFTSPSRRHRFTFNPLQATGIRLLVPNTGIGGGTCIDELEVNPPDSVGDIAFGAEFKVKRILVPAQPFTKSDEEWIELYNRGSNSVNLLGWRFDQDLDYLFTNTTILNPGDFLVLAKEATALQAKWPESAARIMGTFTNGLSEDETIELKDAVGNIADRIRIHKIGFTDGDGSSLELIDPRANNQSRSVWQGSNERTNSQWETIRYRTIAGQAYGSSLWNEFRLGLLEAGEVLIDDVQVIHDPDGAAIDTIQNGDFEITIGNTHWRMLGSHLHSGIIPDPDDPTNHVLKVVATTAARTSHNHIESSYVGNTPVTDGMLYEVSFRARWQTGTPLVHSSSYHQRLARATPLPLPPRLGTPGLVNSTYATNSGPTFRDLSHAPVVPSIGEAVTIFVRAEDPDSVAAATLFYRLNPSPTFSSQAMTLQSNGFLQSTIPGQVAGQVVQFYIEAVDGLGATATAPPTGPESRALYQVADSQTGCGTAYEIRVIQLNTDRDFLHQPTNVMSQGRVGATVVYKNSEVFYDAAIRLKGSAAGRIRDGDDFVGYDIQFPRDHLFRGVHRSVSIDRSGRAPATRQQHEFYILHLFQQAGLPVHHADLCYFISPKTVHTGSAILQLGGYNGLFVDEQFREDGSTFNFDITYEPSTTDGGGFEDIKLPVPHQAHHRTDLEDLGNDKEQYRVPFSIRTGRRGDDYSSIMRLAKTMGAPQAEFDANIDEALDVDEALRVAALTILCGIGDGYLTGGLEHNLRLYTPADGGPAQFLPWDMDFVSTIGPGASIALSHNMSKFMNHPATLRRYYGHINELLSTVFNSGYMASWLNHFGSVVCQDYTAATGYIDARSTSVITQLPSVTPFVITSNGGNDFITNTPTVTIQGTAWIDIFSIGLASTLTPIQVSFTSATNWTAEAPLMLGTNRLTFIGYDLGGMPIATDRITVVTSDCNGGVDSDGDGMPDLWELASGFNLMIDDGQIDSDGDGLLNLEEYIAGTDPMDAGHFLQLTVAHTGTMAHLNFQAVEGRSYTVEFRDELQTGSWQKLTEVNPDFSERPIQLNLPLTPGHRRYFRLVTPAQP